MISVSCDREMEEKREREREVRVVAASVSSWHRHSWEEDDVNQLLEKLDPAEADDDAPRVCIFQHSD